MLNASREFKDAVYALVRSCKGRFTLTINGTTKTYTNDKILDIKILEEMNVINNTLPSNECTITLDNTDGEFNYLNNSNIQAIISQKPKMVFEIGVELSKTIEYVSMGTFFLIEWKNEIGSMSVTLVGRDNFDMLEDISYSNTSSNTLYNIAKGVLDNAGITNYYIDESLKTINTQGFIERINSRKALQHIGISGRCAVYQDRNGRVNLKSFKEMDKSNNFLYYCGQSNVFCGVVYPATNDGYDMKNITFSNQFKEPQVKLDKPINEVVINIYENGNKREYVYVNPDGNSKNGISFKIDNPLINTEQVAIDVAKWIIEESKYTAIYNTQWRQNPILECGDMVLVEDSFDAKKQTRITKQEFEYKGYLKGKTESRGGM